MDIDFINPAFNLIDAEFSTDDPERPNHKILDKSAVVVLETDDLSLEGEYNLVMTVSDLKLGKAPGDPSNELKVWIYRENLCDQGFRGVPADQTERYEFQFGQETPLVIPLTQIDNTECDFEVELEGNDAQAMQIIQDAVQLTQPVLEPDDSDIKTVASDGFLTFETED